MSVGFLDHSDFRLHETGASHPERAERLEAILRAIRDAGLLKKLTRLRPRAALVEELTRVHEPAYVDLVRMSCEEGFTFLGSSDTRVCPRSYEIARLAAGGMITACHEVMEGRVQHAFCAVRPPGHHAERDHAMGFCLFNNVAVAAEMLIRECGVERVAIVDWDVHHGNGTQHIFYERADVLYISLHERVGTLPFPGTGDDNEVGRGRGRGYTLNIPLVAGSGDREYRQSFKDRVLPRLHAFAPQFLLVSAGFDALLADPIGNLSLEPSAFGWMTAALVEVAESHAEGRLVSVLEGGYALKSLGDAVTAHVRALTSRSVKSPIEDESGPDNSGVRID